MPSMDGGPKKQVPAQTPAMGDMSGGGSGKNDEVPDPSKESFSGDLRQNIGGDVKQLEQQQEARQSNLAAEATQQQGPGGTQGREQARESPMAAEVSQGHGGQAPQQSQAKGPEQPTK